MHCLREQIGRIGLSLLVAEEKELGAWKIKEI